MAIHTARGASLYAPGDISDGENHPLDAQRHMFGHAVDPGLPRTALEREGEQPSHPVDAEGSEPAIDGTRGARSVTADASRERGIPADGGPATVPQP